MVQVIPINEAGKLQEAYNIRLDENCVVDLKFLHSPLGGRPLLAVLFEDTRRARHIKTYEVALREKVSYCYCGKPTASICS
jgi:DNA damage-binding protein 1